MHILLILNTANDTIADYFQTVCALFHRDSAAMIFCDGNPEAVIPRVDTFRTNGWGERVAELL